MSQEEKERLREEEEKKTEQPLILSKSTEKEENSVKPVTEKKIRIKIAQLGARVHEVEGDDGMTTAEALSRARIDPGELELRINNKKCDLMAKLHDGDILMLVGRYKGGPLLLFAMTVVMLALAAFTKTTWIIPAAGTFIFGLYFFFKKRVPKV